jgi:PAS domain S-box-containing protein
MDISISICPITGLQIISKPEWQVVIPERDYRANISVLGDFIIKAEIHGYSTRKESRKTAAVFDTIVQQYFDPDKGFVQIFDLKHSSGFSTASRNNYKSVITKRKGIRGHIFYNTSTLFNITLKLGRKLHQVGFSAHIVNNYLESVKLANKLITTKPQSSNRIQIDTGTRPFTAFESREFCPVSGLPIKSRPEWTHVDFGNNYFVTFKIIGNTILHSAPSGTVTPQSMEAFLKYRQKFIRENFSQQSHYVEIKDYRRASTPGKLLRHMFHENFKLESKRLAGFIGFNAPIGIKFALNVGVRLMPPHCPFHTVPYYHHAVNVAVSVMNYVALNQRIPPQDYFARIALQDSGIHYTSYQINHYVDEIISFLGNINWEIDGFDRTMGEIPSDHPFLNVYEAISLIKSDLDSVTKDRKNALKALKKSERLYRLLAENALDVIWTTDRSLRPIYISPSAKLLTGYSVDELMNIRLAELLAPSSYKDMKNHLKNFLNAPFPQKNSFLVELENIRKDRSVYWTETTVSSIRDTDGNVMSIIGVSRDISERKLAEADALKSQSELSKAQSQLIQSEKMAALGNLVAGVSHEISTPLGISVTASSFLHSKFAEFERKRNESILSDKDIDMFINLATESVSLISNNLTRAADLINSFKQISVDQSHETKRLYNLHDYTRNIIHSLTPRLKNTSHSIDLVCDENLMIDSYPGALSQIITNLIMNSLIHGF